MPFFLCSVGRQLSNSYSSTHTYGCTYLHAHIHKPVCKSRWVSKHVFGYLIHSSFTANVLWPSLCLCWPCLLLYVCGFFGTPLVRAVFPVLSQIPGKGKVLANTMEALKGFFLPTTLGSSFCSIALWDDRPQKHSYRAACVEVMIERVNPGKKKKKGYIFK